MNRMKFEGRMNYFMLTAIRSAKNEDGLIDIDDDIYNNIVTHNATCWNRNVCGRLYFYWLICQSKI